MVPAPSVGAPDHGASPQPPRDLQAVTQTVTGTVTAAEPRWNDGGDRIFTHVDIALADGSTMTVRQPGGTVGDIGMVQYPSPPLLRPGDRVEASVAQLGASPGWSMLDVTSLARQDLGPVTLPPGHDDGKGWPGSQMLDDTPQHHEFVRTMTDQRAPLYWGSGCAYIVFDSQGTTHLADEQEFEILERTLAHWRDSTASCSYMEFVIEEPRPMEVGYDGFNVVKFREDRWCRPPPAGQTEPECHQPNAAGLTTLTFINNPDSDRYGEILDADIELNGAITFAFSADGVTLGPAGRELADLANTFTHEVGHFLGLDHACRIASEPVRLDHDGREVPLCGGALLEATMHPTQESGETKKASLEQDDIMGAGAIHPVADDPRRCAAVDLTPRRRYCTVAPDSGAGAGGALAALGLLAGGVLLLRRRRGAHR